MYISQTTYEKTNDFLQKCFQMNSYCDNLVYNMSALCMFNAEHIFHDKFAHAFPEFADEITDVMVKLNARPVRKGLSNNTEQYENYKIIFADLKDAVDQYRDDIIGVIESADINGDTEIKITFEKFLYKFMTYLHQANVWYKKSKEYDQVEEFDQDFTTFTFV